MNKKNKKDIESKVLEKTSFVDVQDYNALLEKYQEAEQRIAAMNKAQEEFVKEFSSLKSSIGSYKSANTRMKETVRETVEKYKAETTSLNNDINQLKREHKTLLEIHQKLSEQNSKLKVYSQEADELNQQKATRIEELKKELKAANENVNLVSQNNKTLTDEICALNANIEWYNALPWYRKIFIKKI